MWNRTGERAERLLRDFGDDRLEIRDEAAGEAADVVVNATALGMEGSPVPEHLLRAVEGSRGVLDQVYSGGPSAFVTKALGLGIPGASGEGMLVAQAEVAYERWFGDPPPAGAMARALGEPRP